MGTYSKTSLGWIAEFVPGYDVMDMQDHVAHVYQKSEWCEFIFPTDQILGKNNHIAVFNRTEYAKNITNSDHTVIDFTNFQVPSVPAPIQEFIDAINDEYGEGSVKVYYGIVHYYY
jgi:hypothetical protein